MHDMLREIVRRRRVDIRAAKQALPLSKLSYKTGKKGSSYFVKRLRQAPDVAVIAEIKLASPSHPTLGDAADVTSRAKAYEAAGADAISFITEPHYFKGDIAYVPRLKKLVALPILQKDFVVDEYQIYQACAAGSDALLFIARLLEAPLLNQYVALALSLGVEPVVEINSVEDLDKAVQSTARVIAVNARDLDTFEVDVAQACQLLQKVPDTFLRLGFSGIFSVLEVRQYEAAGANGVLVGTGLMQASSIDDFIKKLRRRI